ncbi:hypothetical protein RAM_00775 [Amycolatopsis mediterranei S699]|nr:hypothetical protein RAM_00775 [Amycolatopsis mediterranei S699]
MPGAAQQLDRLVEHPLGIEVLRHRDDRAEGGIDRAFRSAAIAVPKSVATSNGTAGCVSWKPRSSVAGHSRRPMTSTRSGPPRTEASARSSADSSSRA